MEDNGQPDKSHVPRHSWVGQNGWSASSAGGPPHNTLAGSQHLGLGPSPDQTSSCNHLQTSGHGCLSDLGALSSANDAHPSALYKTPHAGGNLSPATLIANTAIPHALSMLLATNQQKTTPPTSLPQPNQVQHLPLLSPQSVDPYKASFRPPLTNQGLLSGLQELSMSLSSCRQRFNASQATLGDANMASAGVAGYTHSYGPSTSQEQPQWMSSSPCGGAVNVNESVADAAARPNNEDNAPPLASNEGWRSALLQQRAQLIKLLEDMDKLLQSIPSDDSSEEPPLQTGNELSAGPACSSPASYDGHNQTWNAPLSAGESPKTQNNSGESGDDSDPDYSPQSDGDDDFQTDSQSNTEEGSSEELSDDVSGENGTAGNRCLAGKKRTRSERSSRKTKGAKKARASDADASSEAVVLPTSNKKTRRVYDKRNYCVFCSKPLSKMARHFEKVHSDKAEVAVAFQYPVHSRERLKIWKKLINQGNFAHNKEVLRTGKGQLAVSKRPNKTGQAKDFLHCLYCHGFFLKKTLYRHMRLCAEKVKSENESQTGRQRIASRCALETFGDLGVSDGFKNVLCEMIYDDVTRAVLRDRVILQFGEQLFKQHGSDAKKHDHIRQNLRQMARLVLEAQKITPLTNLEDFFHPSSFRHVVSAVKVLAGYDPENKTFSIPSLAIKLGYSLQKACGIVEGNATERGDSNLAESARNFLSVYQKKWNELISSGALTTLRETKLTADKNVPFVQDVKLLNFHVESVHVVAETKLRDEPSAENYAALAKSILVRTIIFNRRKPGEVSGIQITTFTSRKKSNVLTDLDVSVSDLERAMCGFFARVDIRGNSGRMVPVLLKPSFESAMELLVKTRETCGVPRENPFVFGRPNAMSAYRGSECIQQFVKECGAKNPEALTSRKILKHYSTMLQLMNLDDHEANQILGPNNQLQTLRQNSSVQLEDAGVNFEARLQPEAGQRPTSWDHAEPHQLPSYQPADFYHQQPHGVTTTTMTTGASMTSPQKCFISGSNEFQNKGKHKWEEAEVRAVERHMMRFIQEHKVPQKNDCVRCLEAEPKALGARSWKGVKDYVRNRITALKRQSGASQSLSANGLELMGPQQHSLM